MDEDKDIRDEGEASIWAFARGVVRVRSTRIFGGYLQASSFCSDVEYTAYLLIYAPIQQVLVIYICYFMQCARLEDRKSWGSG